MSRTTLGRDIPETAGAIGTLAPFSGAWARAEGVSAERKLLSAGRPSKVLPSVEEAVRRSGLESGMTISFHHHFREGDSVVNRVLDAIARAGIRDLTLAPSSLTSVHAPLVEHCRSGVIRRICTSGLRGKLADEISRGLLDEPVLIHSHGGRARALREGSIRPDVAFLGASVCDSYGNASGSSGKSACGSLGYAIVDARYARSVVVLTDGLADFPAVPASIGQQFVDWVVPIDAVGDPKGIGVGATRISRDPRELLIARNALAAIDATGLLRDGFSFQTGTGGASLAVIRYLRELMLERGIKAAFCLGGITGQVARMLEEGLVGSILDVQSFDADAARSMAVNSRHIEVDAMTYADPGCPGAAVNMLDFVVLSALEVDVDFNVNVITGSDGVIRGASGGHSDTAAGATVSVVVAPLVRARTASIVDRVETVVTPGESVDLFVTDRGTAVNPRRPDLAAALRAAGVEVRDIRELRELARSIVGEPDPVEYGKRVVGLVEYRDGTIIDAIREVK
ncbi:MAG: citrate lyase subunit alpha [Spirochaetes bacterium GWB1_59_5]|nr:MAG: citrate lyase subunit alpha [Spirochaetes bacterium GWB1_59_5]